MVISRGLPRRCETTEALKKALPALRAELDDPDSFAEIYRYTFDWAKEEGQKSLALEMAVGLWEVRLFCAPRLRVTFCGRVC